MAIWFLQKLIVTPLVMTFPTFYGTRQFIAAYARASHITPSWARRIQHTFITPNSILPFQPHEFPSGPFLLRSPTKITCFIRIYPVVFTIIETQTQYTVRHNTSMLYSNVLHGSVHQTYHWAPLLHKFKIIRTFATCKFFVSEMSLIHFKHCLLNIYLHCILVPYALNLCICWRCELHWL